MILNGGVEANHGDTEPQSNLATERSRAVGRIAFGVSVMRKPSKREFSVIVERDEDGYYVASVPELRGCHTQARSLDKLMQRVREAIAVSLETEHDVRPSLEFVGVQRIAV